ncbi:MAG: 5'(3')-deoxyribonucleotidase [Tannerella sp.]|jgi:5'(3')-deoxyribonucleotidase|nr:5'(3')-deoxyribonucleotidase [Tannerella sp.]
MEKQVLVDMDGVLADVYTQFINWEYNDSGIKLNIEDLYGKIEADAFPSCDKHVRSVGFFRTVPLISDSVEGLKYLNDKYKVLIVSSATEFPDSLVEKEKWLNEHFPFISWRQMIFCGSKESIQGDVMIDDHPKNLQTFSGQKILFTQPHNVYVQEESYHRVFGWKDILEIL